MEKQCKLYHFNQFIYAFYALMGVSILDFIYRMLIKEITGIALVSLRYRTYIWGIVCLWVLGFIQSNNGFNVMMSICAKRKKYLLMSLETGIIESVVMTLVIKSLDKGFGLIGENGWGIKLSVIYPDNFNLGHLILISFLCFSMGFVMGAIFYRCKKSTAWAIMSLFPIWLSLSILGELGFESELGSKSMRLIYYLIHLLGSEVGVILYSSLCSLLAYGLLHKAPIKAYAHDLI